MLYQLARSRPATRARAWHASIDCRYILNNTELATIESFNGLGDLVVLYGRPA
jgi:hypothetical protein